MEDQTEMQPVEESKLESVDVPADEIMEQVPSMENIIPVPLASVIASGSIEPAAIIKVVGLAATNKIQTLMLDVQLGCDEEPIRIVRTVSSFEAMTQHYKVYFFRRRIYPPVSPLLRQLTGSALIETCQRFITRALTWPSVRGAPFLDNWLTRSEKELDQSQPAISPAIATTSTSLLTLADKLIRFSIDTTRSSRKTIKKIFKVRESSQEATQESTPQATQVEGFGAPSSDNTPEIVNMDEIHDELERALAVVTQYRVAATKLTDGIESLARTTTNYLTQNTQFTNTHVIDRLLEAVNSIAVAQHGFSNPGLDLLRDEARSAVTGMVSTEGAKETLKSALMVAVSDAREACELLHQVEALCEVTDLGIKSLQGLHTISQEVAQGFRGIYSDFCADVFTAITTASETAKNAFSIARRAEASYHALLVDAWSTNVLLSGSTQALDPVVEEHI